MLGFVFPQLLAEARKRRDANQGEIAAELGVSQRTISSWELGKTLPEPEKVDALAAALRLDVGELRAAYVAAAAARSDAWGAAAPGDAAALVGKLAEALGAVEALHGRIDALTARVDELERRPE